MKAFEEWRVRQPYMNFAGYSHEAEQFAVDRDQKIWRAALEWVRQSDRVWMEDLNRDIDRELED